MSRPETDIGCAGQLPCRFRGSVDLSLVVQSSFYVAKGLDRILQLQIVDQDWQTVGPDTMQRQALYIWTAHLKMSAQRCMSVRREVSFQDAGNPATSTLTTLSNDRPIGIDIEQVPRDPVQNDADTGAGSTVQQTNARSSAGARRTRGPSFTLMAKCVAATNTLTTQEQ